MSISSPASSVGTCRRGSSPRRQSPVADRRRAAEPRLKHRWRIDRNYLAGITLGQWRRLLRENRFAVDAVYWHRAAFITLKSILNSRASRKDERRHGREIEKTAIDPPLFILGHWRTGALLHKLFARDSQFAYPSLHQVIHPGSFLSNGDGAPPDDPQEDECAVALSCLRSPDLAWSLPRNGGRYERYLTFDGVPTVEVEEWKRTLLWFLKKLTFRHRRPLVLKSPPHTARIRLLLDLFPAARFVNVHREPYALFQSWRHTHDTAIWFLYLQKPDLGRIDDRLLKTGQVLFDAYFEQRKLIPPGRLVDVAYESLEARPVEVMQEIYAKLGLSAFEDVRPRLQAYVDSLATHRKSQLPELAPEVRQKVARVWRRAFDEWGYSV